MNFSGVGTVAALRVKVNKLGMVLSHAFNQTAEELLQEEKFLELAGQFVGEFKKLNSSLGTKLPSLLLQSLAEEEPEKRDEQECMFYGDKISGNKLIISSSIKDYQQENREGTTYFYQTIDSHSPTKQSEKSKPDIKSPRALPKKQTKPIDSPSFAGIKKENWFTTSETPMPKKLNITSKLSQGKQGSPAKLTKPDQLGQPSKLQPKGNNITINQGTTKINIKFNTKNVFESGRGSPAHNSLLDTPLNSSLNYTPNKHFSRGGFGLGFQKASDPNMASPPNEHSASCRSDLCSFRSSDPKESSTYSLTQRLRHPVARPSQVYHDSSELEDRRPSNEMSFVQSSIDRDRAKVSPKLQFAPTRAIPEEIEYRGIESSPRICELELKG